MIAHFGGRRMTREQDYFGPDSPDRLDDLDGVPPFHGVIAIEVYGPMRRALHDLSLKH
jgi:hypothetical protein